jgi:hypothetical protein
MQNEDNLELVLVHLGDKFPRILKANLKYIKIKFPKIQLTVIVDNIKNIEYLKKNDVNSRLYADLNDINHLFENHNFSSEFRNGFWQTSTKRLFAFLEYCSVEPFSPKIHMENDIHLFPNFPFNKFNKLNKLAWLGYNDSRDVGSIIFCPNKIEADWLTSELIKKMSETTDFTDMTLLRYVSLNNPQKMIKLPIAESFRSDLFSPEVDRDERERNSQYFKTFGGIFDAAPLGMWITGQDPRNHRGKLLLHVNHKDSFIQPGYADYSSDVDNCLYLSEKAIPIYNLHVHSKDLNVIGGNVNSLKKYIKLAKNKDLVSKYSFTLFLKLLCNFLLKRILGLIRAKK